MKSRDFTPLIMWFFLLAGIIVIAFIRLRRVAGVWDEYPVNFDTVFISSYILWMIVELRVSKKDTLNSRLNESDCSQ